MKLYIVVGIYKGLLEVLQATTDYKRAIDVRRYAKKRGCDPVYLESQKLKVDTE